MIKENRTTKYLLYAIGEIVLVVIGILIALQVNNWNQEAKDRAAGQKLLIRIQHDLTQDTTTFRAIIDRNLRLRNEIKALLVTLYDGVESINQVKEMSNIYDKVLDQSFSPNDNTYSGIVSSGTLGLIRNPGLKEEIVGLYSEYDQSEAMLSSISDWMINVVAAVDTETDFIKFGNDVSDIYTTEEMLNEQDFAFMNDKDGRQFKILVRAISAAAFNQKVNNAYYEGLLIKCEKVLGQIDEELKIES